MSLRSIACLAALVSACGPGRPGETVITFPGSAVGKEHELLVRQVERFERAHPGVRVDLQPTPDDATQRHQIYVQRLNARDDDPDVLQLDVVWTPEFAAAGWILALDRPGLDPAAFFPAAIAANTWNDSLYAIPWFVDVGMLYWRTDLLERAPESMDELVAAGIAAMRGPSGVPRGIVWQGARYEGLVTVFLEYLGGFGGRILTPAGDVVVDSPEAVRALEFMRDEIRRWEIAPEAVLTWHEEETRFAFQNGTSAMMRNWPYAWTLLSAPESRVAGRFAVAPMPGAPGGRPTAALGGSQLAVSAHSDVPDQARQLIEFLAAPEQMLERAAIVGQLPARRGLYDDPRLDAALPMPAASARAVIVAATPRPVTPIWSQLSEILQIRLHRALVGQVAPEAALKDAAERMRRVIAETGVRRLHGGAG